MTEPTPWAMLSLRLPGHVGHQARQALAKLDDAAGHPLPEPFWHYRDGYPVSDRLPPVRIGASPRRVWLAGVGREGAVLLYENARTVARLFMEGAGYMPAFEFQEGDLAVEPLGFSPVYRFQNVALNLPGTARATLKAGGLGDPDAMEVVRARMEGALARFMAEYLPGHPVPAIDHLVHLDKAVAVAHRGRGYRIVVSGTCAIPADLRGHWQIGSLQARGYGRLNRQRGAKPRREGRG